MTTPSTHRPSKILDRRCSIFGGTTSRAEWLALWPLLLRPEQEGRIDSFEALAARTTGATHAVSFAAGRMALYALLSACGIGQGDEIILPGFTCAVVPNAMKYLGITPVYADIEPATFNLNPAAAEASITPRTRAIYAQHTFGLSCDAPALRRIADRHGLLLIEDFAHSLGASCAGRPHGSWGHVGFFSTDRTKVINAQVGGCAVTNDPALAERIRAVQARSDRLGSWTERRIAASLILEQALTTPAIFRVGRPMLGGLRRIGLRYSWRDENFDAIPQGYPYPARMPASVAAAAERQLRRLEPILQHRRAVAELLENTLRRYAWMPTEEFRRAAWLRYSFLVRSRDDFERRFRGRFELGTWFTHPIFGRERTANAVGYLAGSCPHAEHAARHIVNFPTHPRIDLRMIERLIETDGAWLKSQLLENAADAAPHSGPSALNPGK